MWCILFNKSFNLPSDGRFECISHIKSESCFINVNFSCVAATWADGCVRRQTHSHLFTALEQADGRVRTRCHVGPWEQVGGGQRWVSGDAGSTGSWERESSGAGRHREKCLGSDSGSCFTDPEHGGGAGSHLQPGEIPHYQRGTGGECPSLSPGAAVRVGPGLLQPWAFSTSWSLRDFAHWPSEVLKGGVRGHALLACTVPAHSICFPWALQEIREALVQSQAPLSAGGPAHSAARSRGSSE